MGVPFFGPLARLIFGTRNQRMVKRYLAEVARVNSFEPGIRALTDAELRAKSEEFRRRIAAGEKALDLRAEVFAVAREAMDRAVGLRTMLDPATDLSGAAGSVLVSSGGESAPIRGLDASKLPAEAREMLESLRAQVATPLGVGRTVAALASATDLTHPGLMERTGTIQWVEDLAEEFDIADEHGRRPAAYARRR